MTIQEATSELKKQQNIICKASERIAELTKVIELGGDTEYDWISVRRGAELIGVSVWSIYQKIDTGKLSCKHINSKKLVKKSELLRIDDCYEK